MAWRSEAVAAPSLAEAVPGLEAAQRAFTEAQQHEASLAQGLPSIRREAAIAAEAIERVAWRVKVRGGAAQPAYAEERAAAEAVIAGVPGRVAIQQDAIRQAEADTKRAEAGLATVMVEELRRRAAPARAASDAALARFLEEQEDHNRLDTLASELQRARVGNLQELDHLLAPSEDFAAPAGTVVVVVAPRAARGAAAT